MKGPLAFSENEVGDFSWSQFGALGSLKSRVQWVWGGREGERWRAAGSARLLESGLGRRGLGKGFLLVCLFEDE